MCWAFSIIMFLQLRSAVKVVLRQQQGGVTVDQLRRDIAAARALGQGGDEVERAGQLHPVSEKCWAVLAGIRGTHTYWKRAGQHLFAMLRQLGAPTWFLTLSAAEAHWPDLFAVLSPPGTPVATPEQREAYLASLSQDQRRAMIAARPLDVARHFDNRWRVCLAWLMGPDEPLGKLRDYWWRIEFQRRGSPHVHAMLWVEDAPDPSQPGGRQEVLQFLDRYISSQIPDAAEHPELHRLVTSLQQHRHTHTCNSGGGRGGGRGQCRFDFPRMQCEATRFVTPEDRGRVRRCDTYLTKRGPEDVSTNPYNPALTMAWRGNTDLQMINTGGAGGDRGSGGYAAAVYAAAYISKAETPGLQSAVREALENLPRNSTLEQQMLKIGTSLLSKRPVSLQEVAYQLAGLPLKGSSRGLVRICVGFPENRAGILSTAAYRAAHAAEEEEAAEGEEEGQEAGGGAEAAAATMPSLFDKYARRPLSMEDTTLFQFAEQYEVGGRGGENLLHVPGTHACLSTRKVRRSATAQVVQICPRTTYESHGAEHLYVQASLFCPWRDEARLPRDEGELEELLLQRAPQLEERRQRDAAADALLVEVERIRVLREEEGLDPFGAVRPGAEAMADEDDAEA